MIDFGNLTVGAYKAQGPAEWSKQKEQFNPQLATAPLAGGSFTKPITTEAATQGLYSQDANVNAALSFVKNGIDFEGMEKINTANATPEANAIAEAKEFLNKLYEDADFSAIANSWNGSPNIQGGAYDRFSDGTVGENLLINA